MGCLIHMKKIINCFLNKMSDKKIIITLILLIFYQFIMFLDVSKEKIQFNVYDLIIYQFNYLSLVFMLSIGFLIITYNINYNSEFNQYLLLKFNNKKQYFNINTIIVFITSFLYVLMFNIVAFIESFGKISLENNWSQFFINNTTGVVNIHFDINNINNFLNFVSPLKYTIILNILVFLYFSTLGLLFLMINSILNKRAITLIIIIATICLNMASDSIQAVSNFTFTNNIYILTSNNFIFSDFNYFYKKLFYWLIIIVTIYIIGLIIYIKKDYKYGD